MSDAVLVIGLSDQIPGVLRAYGTAVRSWKGRTYSAATGQVSDYREFLDHMLAVVVATLPIASRERGRRALIRRWNGDWGVNEEDLSGTSETSG